MVTDNSVKTGAMALMSDELQHLIDRTRQSHAMEHATIHVLGQRYPSLPIMGRSTPGGFYVYGDVPTADVASAATEALGRLQAGESRLAVHPRCGTNLVVGSLLSGTISLLIMSRRGGSLLEKVPMVFLGVTLALFAAQPVGYAVQEHLTTLADVTNVRIAAIERQSSMGSQTAHHIRLTRD